MRIFYSPNINKLITLYLMENDYDLSLNRIDHIINSRPDVLEDLLSIIHLVLEHKKSFTILGREAIPHDKKFYLRASLKDIVSHLNSNPEDDDLKSILDKVPSSLIRQLIEDRIIRHKKKDTYSPLFASSKKDVQLSIFFLDDMQELDGNLAICKRLRFPPELIRELFPLTIRLFIPKDITLSVPDGKLIYKSPLFVKDHLITENLKESSKRERTLAKYKATIDTMLYETTGCEMYLSGNTVYSAIITMNIEEWIRFIDTTSKIDQSYDHPVVSAIPYFAYQYRHLYELLGTHEWRMNLSKIVKGG